MDVFQTTITGAEQKPAILCLMSDLHLDAKQHNRNLLISDLEAAKKLGARISINGDSFDGILPSDMKRFHPGVATTDMARDDLINQMVRMGVEVLSPYADLIDMISPGNHERSILKYHHLDVTSMLIYGLNVQRTPGLPPIHQGSYRGFQKYLFKLSNKNLWRDNLVIFRHHGRGGSAPVTGGALDLNRIRQDFDADLYWLGHKHQNIARAFTRVSLNRKGTIKVRKQRAIMSAGYTKQLQEESPNDYGDIGDFGETFYQVSEAGAQWVMAKIVQGKNRRLEWSTFDNPMALLNNVE